LDKVTYANIYKLSHFARENQRPIIVDIGASSGFFTYLCNVLGAEHVYAFEPYIDNFLFLIKNNALAIESGKTSVFNLGVSDPEESFVCDMGVSKNSTPPSPNYQVDFNNPDFVLPNRENEDKLTSISPAMFVPFKVILNQFVKEKVIHLLKMNMNLLSECSNELDNVQNVCGQFYSGDETEANNMVLRLKSKGFAIVNFFPLKQEDSFIFMASRSKEVSLFGEQA
jgi:FkbM family methyltransferase